jgi:hypothetical protein
VYFTPKSYEIYNNNIDYNMQLVTIYDYRLKALITHKIYKDQYGWYFMLGKQKEYINYFS